MASARRLRRQRNLSQIEIPEDHVTISEELLGKGGFGSVYIADYNGRNAAAKVWEIIASVEVIKSLMPRLSRDHNYQRPRYPSTDKHVQRKVIPFGRPMCGVCR